MGKPGLVKHQRLGRLGGKDECRHVSDSALLFRAYPEFSKRNHRSKFNGKVYRHRRIRGYFPAQADKPASQQLDFIPFEMNGLFSLD